MNNFENSFNLELKNKTRLLKNVVWLNLNDLDFWQFQHPVCSLRCGFEVSLGFPNKKTSYKFLKKAYSKV
jgi:hypothetical protein